MNRCIVGSCLDVLPTLEAGSVQTCVTSPPYWGLRDYGTAKWDGGDADCDHRHPAEQRQLPHGDGRVNDSYADNRVLKTGVGAMFKGACGKCGAHRVDNQLGLESTPEEYVERMVSVFREVRRVLADDGTLWLNLGDSYNAYNGNAGPSSGFSAGSAADTQRPKLASGHGLRTNGLKPKDLVGIPWRVAFALQADGWYLRQDIIWHKPNPMPESVRDRCTKSHEYIFLLSKSERYYFDADAIAEPISESYASDTRPHGVLRQHFYPNSKYVKAGMMDAGVGTFPTGKRDETRNKRSVWTVTTKPFSGAHFATFPSDLIEPCILAGSKPGDVVLDPFGGSGTTGMVAEALGRQWLLIELNPAYAELSRERTAQQGMAFA